MERRDDDVVDAGQHEARGFGGEAVWSDGVVVDARDFQVAVHRRVVVITPPYILFSRCLTSHHEGLQWSVFLMEELALHFCDWHVFGAATYGVPCELLVRGNRNVWYGETVRIERWGIGARPVSII
jgi:hypothetical protein